MLPVYGDGYCFIQSITKCLQNVGRHISKSALLNEIEEEILCHIGYYKQFMSLEDTDPVGEMPNYIKHAVYESDIGDMVLHIVGNLLNIRIVVLHYYPLTNEYELPHKRFIISPVVVVSELPLPIQQTIMLLKNSKHYDDLIFKGFFYFSFSSKLLL